MKTIEHYVAVRIRNALKDRGRIRDFSQKTGIAGSTVSGWINRDLEPIPRHMNMLCDYTGYPKAYFFDVYGIAVDCSLGDYSELEKFQLCRGDCCAKCGFSAAVHEQRVKKLSEKLKKGDIETSDDTRKTQ